MLGDLVEEENGVLGRVSIRRARLRFILLLLGGILLIFFVIFLILLVGCISKLGVCELEESGKKE